MFFFCPGWWHSTYVEEAEGAEKTAAEVEAENAAAESSGKGWKRPKQPKRVESLSLHAYVDLRPAGWQGQGMGGLEQTDLLRTSVGATLAQSARATEYGNALTNSTSNIRRDQAMIGQLVVSSRVICRCLWLLEIFSESGF